MDANQKDEKLGRKALIAGALSMGALALLKPAAVLAAGTDFQDPVTGFAVRGRFAQFYDQNGGLPIFGRPLSNVLSARLEDGNVYQIQWFERARFEAHPENSYPNDVQLGQFGRLVMNGQVTSGCSGGSPLAQSQPGAFGRPFNLPHDPDLEAMPKSLIETAPRRVWYHRYLSEVGGIQDSWALTWALLEENGGHFEGWGNPGQIIFTHLQQECSWQVAILTTAKWKSQFLAGRPGPIQLNIRTTPGSWISLVGPSGDIRISQQTSDMGDMTISMPDACRVTIAGSSRIHDMNGQTFFHWGPRGRDYDIDLINGPDYQW